MNDSPALRGCTMLIILAIAVACLSLIAAALTPVHADCNVIGLAQPANAYFNVRGTPGNTTQTPIATIKAGTSIAIVSTRQASGDVWLLRCEGGAVAASVAKFVTVTYAPSTLTPAGPTRTPVPTFTNVPDLPRYLVIDQYGSPWECSDELPVSEVVLIYHREVLPCALAPVRLTPTPTRIKP